MAGAWGKLQRRHPERGSATLQADDAASARASARGRPLRAAQTRRPALSRGRQQAPWSFCGPTCSWRARYRSGQTTEVARGSTGPSMPAGETRDASSSTSGRTPQRCSVPAPALAIGRSGSAAGGTSALQRTCGSRTDRMGTAQPAAWHLVRARVAYVCIVTLDQTRRPPRASLSRPGAPQERSPLIPDVCQYRTCVIWPFSADMDDLRRGTQSPDLAVLFPTV